MHYFKFEVKEWVANAAHLSLEEEAAYLRLILHYYETEGPINEDTALRRCRIPAAIGRSVLGEFFIPEGGLWLHEGCDEIIALYHANRESKSRGGKASAASRAKLSQSTPVQHMFNTCSTEGQQKVNRTASNSLTQELINPLTQENTKRAKLATPDGVSESVWADFLAHRKAKKSPVTQTAINGLVSEAAKSGLPLQTVLETMCQRGWTGFKAEWIAKDRGKPEKFDPVAYVNRNRTENIIDVTPIKGLP